VSPVNRLSRRFLRTLIAVALIAQLSGCATLLAGGPDQVPVATDPPGAFVYLNGGYVGQTPTVVTLNRDLPAQIQIYLPGYHPIVMMRSKTFNMWTIGSLLMLGFLVPIIVDLATGNYMRYDDTGIAVGLVPSQAPPPMWYQAQPPEHREQPLYHQPGTNPPAPQPYQQPYQPPATSQPPYVQPPIPAPQPPR
jgi:hypothetical protein